MPPALGLLLALASPIFYSLWIVLSARLAGARSVTDHASGAEATDAVDEREETDPATAAAVMMTATFVVYWIAATVTGRPVTPSAIPSGAWIGLLGVGIVSAGIAVQTFYAGARRIGAANASLASTIEPVYTIVLATILFGESLTPVQVAGGALVIGGVILAQTAPKPRGEAPAKSPVRVASAGGDT
jgi:drug/metabolite transporter (DMT)-like permease